MTEDPFAIKAYKFLFEVFFGGNDVRFFNEYLWLSQKDDHYLMAILHFKNHLKQNGYYNYCYDEAIKPCPTIEKETKSLVKEDFKNTTVGLIGTPFHFITAYFKFKKNRATTSRLSYPNKLNKCKRVKYYDQM